MWGILRQFVAFNEHSTEDERAALRATSADKTTSASSSSPRLRRNAEKNGTVPDGGGEGEKGAGGSPTKTTATSPAATSKKAAMMKNRIYTSQIAYPTVNGAPVVNHGGRIFNTNGSNLTRSANATMDRDRIRMEFYATYDVMTGIRIAATLSGFFAFVIVLVMYKSRSHTNQALKDPKIVAVAAAVVLEEEERELQEKLDATGLSLYADDINYEYRRQRLLSLGGFDPALIESPRRYSYGGIRPTYNSNIISRPGSRHSGSERGSRHSYDYRDQYQRDNLNDDEFMMLEQPAEELQQQLEQENNDEFEEIEFRSYPQIQPRASSYDSRRCSSITCCSTESSYLERRCSALTLGIYSIIGPSLAGQQQQPPPTTPSTSANPDYPPCSVSEFTMPAALHYQPTTLFYPPSSNASTRAQRSNSHRFSSRRRRSSSRRSSSLMRRAKEDVTEASVTLAPDTETAGSSTFKRTAPLASLSSFRISISMDQQDLDLGSDSVFCENYVDTDEEVAQFSSDSCDEGVVNGGEVASNGNRKVFIENPIREGLDSESIPMNDVNQLLGSNGADEIEITIEVDEEEDEEKGEEEKEMSGSSLGVKRILRRTPEVGNITRGGGSNIKEVTTDDVPEALKESKAEEAADQEGGKQQTGDNLR